MPFGRETHVVPGNIILVRGPRSPTGRGDLGGFETLVRSDAACVIIIITIIITHLFNHLFFLNVNSRCFSTTSKGMLLTVNC